MGVLNEYRDYRTIWPSVLAVQGAVSAERHVDIDPDYVTGGMIDDYLGAYRTQKLVPPGFMIGTIPGSTKHRILPRFYGSSSTSSDEVAASFGNLSDTYSYQVMLPVVAGEVLTVLAPHARYTVSSSSGGWVAGDTLTTTIDGAAVVYTVVSEDIGGNNSATDINIAAKVVAALKASILATRIKVYYNTNTAVFSVTGDRPYTTTAADTGTNGTYAVGASAMVQNAAIGTIESVSVENQLITLTGNASTAVSNGVPIGVATSLPVEPFTVSSSPYNGGYKVLGMLSPQQGVDLLYEANTFYGLYTDIPVYAERLPYWDAELARLYPGIKLV